MFSETFEHISAAPVGRWTEALSEFEGSVIELIAGKLMPQLGYSYKGKKGLALWLRVAYWQSRYYLWKLLKGKQRAHRITEIDDERDQVL
jgi:hypothetical protein